MLITWHGQFAPAINVINIYGPQESRTSIEQISDLWDTLLKQMHDIISKGEHFCLIGDLNGHVGSYISGNSDRVS